MTERQMLALVNIFAFYRQAFHLKGPNRTELLQKRLSPHDLQLKINDGSDQMISMEMNKYLVLCGILIILLNLMGTESKAKGFDRLPEIIIVSHYWYQDPPSSRGFPCPSFFISKDIIEYGCYPSSKLLIARERIDSYSLGLSPDVHFDDERSDEVKPEQFIYQARFRNSGLKAIKAIDWDYVFLDPETGKELARRRFNNEEKLKPGQSRTFVHSSSSPPTLIVKVENLTKKDSETYREMVVVQKIVYADGTAWTKGVN